eukprot:649619-Alexandrium_andersonii.AAC.1
MGQSPANMVVACAGGRAIEAHQLRKWSLLLASRHHPGLWQEQSSVFALALARQSFNCCLCRMLSLKRSESTCPSKCATRQSPAPRQHLASTSPVPR